MESYFQYLVKILVILIGIWTGQSISRVCLFEPCIHSIL